MGFIRAAAWMLCLCACFFFARPPAALGEALGTTTYGGQIAPASSASVAGGYEAAAPVIAALEAYRQSNHAYPQSLDLLAPKFLSGEKLIAKLAGGTEVPFKYRLTGTSYELSFSYTGPGTNQCVYRASAKA